MRNDFRGKEGSGNPSSECPGGDEKERRKMKKTTTSGAAIGGERGLWGTPEKLERTARVQRPAQQDPDSASGTRQRQCFLRGRERITRRQQHRKSGHALGRAWPWQVRSCSGHI
ncbi:hypothetical protein NDU88_001374 [Pleurodeles waltl]|uniref:Uncharacterized protein n=1 Tax=Pleurodeles waltl TaxID=8319 RepID=A0AAV7VW79_PLEWA|nr:hypothetical protein NDU88_001374 [Pleurodeles waltl]